MNLHLRFVLSVTAAIAAAGSAEAATRVGLVSGQTGAQIENVLDTATALLSTNADVQFLDRTEIESVLREHQLSLAGLVGAEHAIKVGQLLHADLFAVLEGSVTKPEPTARAQDRDSKCNYR